MILEDERRQEMGWWRPPSIFVRFNERIRCLKREVKNAVISEDNSLMVQRSPLGRNIARGSEDVHDWVLKWLIAAFWRWKSRDMHLEEQLTCRTRLVYTVQARVAIAVKHTWSDKDHEHLCGKTIKSHQQLRSKVVFCMYCSTVLTRGNSW